MGLSSAAAKVCKIFNNPKSKSEISTDPKGASFVILNVPFVILSVPFVILSVSEGSGDTITILASGFPLQILHFVQNDIALFRMTLLCSE